MDSGYYASVTGLIARMDALNVAANNLANVSTNGYKGQNEFYSSLMTSLKKGQGSNVNSAVNDFGVLGGMSLDLTDGTLEKTGNEFDLAIEGPGFFEIERKGGSRYTRNGNFHTDANGYLVTSSGDRVLGEGGPIQLSPGQLSVGSDGVLSQKGSEIGKLKLVVFAANQLTPEGSSSYAANGSPKPASDFSIRQGMLEASNVNPVAATVRLIMAQRQAELLQRAFSIFNNDFNRTASEVLARV